MGYISLAWVSEDLHDLGLAKGWDFRMIDGIVRKFWLYMILVSSVFLFFWPPNKKTNWTKNQNKKPNFTDWTESDCSVWFLDFELKIAQPCYFRILLNLWIVNSKLFYIYIHVAIWMDTDINGENVWLFANLNGCHQLGGKSSSWQKSLILKMRTCIL